MKRQWRYKEGDTVEYLGQSLTIYEMCVPCFRIWAENENERFLFAVNEPYKPRLIKRVIKRLE